MSLYFLLLLLLLQGNILGMEEGVQGDYDNDALAPDAYLTQELEDLNSTVLYYDNDDQRFESQALLYKNNFSIKQQEWQYISLRTIILFLDAPKAFANLFKQLLPARQEKIAHCLRDVIENGGDNDRNRKSKYTAILERYLPVKKVKGKGNNNSSKKVKKKKRT